MPMTLQTGELLVHAESLKRFEGMSHIDVSLFLIQCTKTMVKQFANGKIEAPCKRIDQIYSVRMGSLRLYENGQYATSSTNATAVNFLNPNAHKHYQTFPVIVMLVTSL